MAHTDPSDPHVDPGGEVHGHGVRPTSTAVHHEVTDIPLAGTTRAALIASVAIAVVMLLMWGAWSLFESRVRQADPGRPPMAAEDFGRRLPGTPRLQSVPETDLASYRREQAAKLSGLAWVDQGAGTVRIPIASAMKLIVSRADTFGNPQAVPPADPSFSSPGAARLDLAGAPAAAPLPEHSPSPVPAHGTEQVPQPKTTAPSEQDKPQPAAPPHE